MDSQFLQAFTSYTNCQPLSTSDPAYDEIARGIRATWPNACISMIDQITLPHVRAAFEEWRSKVQVKQEYTLYHGTKEEHVENICKHGFNPSRGKCMVYGYGIYFGTQFATSWHYTGREKDETDLSFIFICKVLPGRITHGSNERFPPVGFDSQVNDTVNPTIFAIPQAKMMIPEYLVRFSKRAEVTTQESEPPTYKLTKKQERLLEQQLKRTAQRLERKAKGSA